MMTTTTVDAASRAARRRDVDTLKREVRRLMSLLAERERGAEGPPASTRSQFLPVRHRDLRDVVMTVAEAAAHLGLGEEQVRRLLRSEKLAGIPLGGRAGWQVSRESVEDMLAARTMLPRQRRASATAARKVRTRR